MHVEGRVGAPVGAAVGALCGRLWISEPRPSMAHFESRRARRGTENSGRLGRHIRRSTDGFLWERRCRQSIAFTLSTISAFPMTHHVECVCRRLSELLAG